MTVLDDAVVDRITEQARQVDFGKAALGFIAAVLVTVGRCFAVAVTAVAWAYVAVRTGYRDVRPHATVTQRR